MRGPRGRRPGGDAVVKALFAISGNVCAFSDPGRGMGGCEQQLADPKWSAVQAIICHIHGWSREGPRFIEMPDEDRNAYENLILLCPTHSNLIDRVEPTYYPAEKLMEMKHRHEMRYATRKGWRPTEQELARYALSAMILVSEGRPPGPFQEDLNEFARTQTDPSNDVSGDDPIDAANDRAAAQQAARVQYRLSASELEVWLLLPEGLTNNQIGERLFISGKTASVHVTNILRKLAVKTRVQAITLAHQLELIDREP